MVSKRSKYTYILLIKIKEVNEYDYGNVFERTSQSYC